MLLESGPGLPMGPGWRDPGKVLPALLLRCCGVDGWMLIRETLATSRTQAAPGSDCNHPWRRSPRVCVIRLTGDREIRGRRGVWYCAGGYGFGGGATEEWGAPDPTVVLFMDPAASEKPLKPGAVVGKGRGLDLCQQLRRPLSFGDCWTLHSHGLDSVDIAGRCWLYQILCCKHWIRLVSLRDGSCEGISNPLPTSK